MSLKMVSVIVASTDGRAGATDVTVEVVAVVAVVVNGLVDVVAVDNDDNVAAVVAVGSVRSVAFDVDVARIADGVKATSPASSSVIAVVVVADVIPVGAAVVDGVTFDVDGPLS